MTIQATPSTRSGDNSAWGGAARLGPTASGPRPAALRPVPVPRAGRRRVLVVDDEQDIADLIKHTLERGGDIEVETVASGDAALKSATERPPDLVVLDLSLPLLSGLEVCRILRQRPATATVPIRARAWKVEASRSSAFEAASFPMASA